MSRHWFVRHGESVANAQGWLAGHRDVPLTERGRAQAAALRDALVGVAPGRVCSSDLTRARETARAAWEGRSPPIDVDPGVRERTVGEWEGQRVADLRASGGLAVLRSWEGRPPGGESHRDLAERALRTLRAHEDGTDTLWFGHGAWIRTVVGLLDGVPFDRIGLFDVGNTEVLERSASAGTWDRLLALT